MESKVNYYSAVDMIDEGIIHLHLYKKGDLFPQVLQEQLIAILDFLKSVDKPEYETLLFNKRIMISRENLVSVHKHIKYLKFPVTDIEIAITLLKKIVTPGQLDAASISQLEKYLLEFSNPLWISSFTKNKDE